MAHTHIAIDSGLPLCGEVRARRFGTVPTCKWCQQIQAGKRKPADPIDTASKRSS